MASYIRIGAKKSKKCYIYEEMPTIRQTIAYTKAMENNGNVSKAMVEAGYSKATASNPQMLTNSLGWQELTEKYLPDKLLLRTNRQGLKATKLVASPTEPDREMPDWQARLKAVEIGLKVKGRMIENATQVNLDGIQIQVIEDKPIVRGDE